MLPDVKSNESPAIILPQAKNADATGQKETPSLFRKKKAEEPIISEPEKEKLTSSFSQLQLEAAWKEFVAIRKKGEITDIEQMIFTRQLTYSGENVVTIGLNSALEINILQRFETELVRFLKLQLKNDHITIEKQVRKDETQVIPYSSIDKYEYMVKKNPALKMLKENLSLDYNV